MNYTKLKQQPKQGGVPRINLNQAAAATPTRDAVTSPIISPANTSAITEQVQIKNTAHIYFDFNEAVVTNTTISKATKSLGLEMQKLSLLQAYPNPVENTLTLKRRSNSIEKLQIQITNINGQAVYETTLSYEVNHTIDVTEFVPGMYFINVNTETSNEVMKVIKK